MWGQAAQSLADGLEKLNDARLQTVAPYTPEHQACMVAIRWGELRGGYCVAFMTATGKPHIYRSSGHQ